jgi:hypothetical protein
VSSPLQSRYVGRVKRSSISLVVFGVALLVTGCYGSTEPATNIGYDNATFRGQGTTGQDGTHVFFEWWQGGRADNVLATLGKDIAGGVTGPYSEPPFTEAPLLRPATQYLFRLCGRETATTCAQTRSLTTLTPTGDRIHGAFAFGSDLSAGGSVDARSDRTGGNPAGRLSLSSDPQTPGIGFAGDVTCVKVNGSQAVVGAVGTDEGVAASGLLEISDNDLDTPNLTADRLDWQVTHGRTAPDCAGQPFGGDQAPALSYVYVYDTP